MLCWNKGLRGRPQTGTLGLGPAASAPDPGASSSPCPRHSVTAQCHSPAPVLGPSCCSPPVHLCLPRAALQGLLSSLVSTELLPHVRCHRWIGGRQWEQTRASPALNNLHSSRRIGKAIGKSWSIFLRREWHELCQRQERAWSRCQQQGEPVPFLRYQDPAAGAHRALGHGGFSLLLPPNLPRCLALLCTRWTGQFPPQDER